MIYYNIFQGNDLINKTIIEGLKLKETDRVRRDSQEYYFQAFFYLTKRFGMPKIWDEERDAGIWIFKVKEFRIHILLDSVFVNFMVFGDARYANYSSRSPYLVAYWRKMEKVSKKLYHEDYNAYNTRIPKLTDEQKKINQEIWEYFLVSKGVDETWTQGQFDEEIKADDWLDFSTNYNQKIIGVNFSDYEKYGRGYSNAKIRFALKTLRQFLNNMLTPIWVRDCAFNLLGKTGSNFEKYNNNIKIEFEKD